MAALLAAFAAGAPAPSIELAAGSSRLLVTEETVVQVRLWLPPLEGDLADTPPFIAQRPPHLQAPFWLPSWKSDALAPTDPKRMPPVVFDGDGRTQPLPPPSRPVALDRFPADRSARDVFRAVCRLPGPRWSVPRNDGRPVNPRDLRPEHWVGRWVLNDSVNNPAKRHFRPVPCTFHAPEGERSAVMLRADGTATATNWALVTWDTKEAFRYPELRGEWNYKYQTNDDLAVVSVRWQPPDDGVFPSGYGFWEDSYWWNPIDFGSPGFGALRADRGDSRHREIEELVLDEQWNYP